MKHRLRDLGIAGAGIVLLGACDEGRSPLGDGYEEAVKVEQRASSFIEAPQTTNNLTPFSVPGAKIMADGVALLGETSGSITVEIPSGDVVGALLYWGARGDAVDPTTIDVTKNGTTVSVDGNYVGESVTDFGDAHTLRADLFPVPGFDWTGLSHTVSLAFPPTHNIEGASLLLTYNDGTDGSIVLMDGNDFAYLNAIPPENQVTNAQDFEFPAVGAPWNATLWIAVGDVELNRPNKLVYSIDDGPDQEVLNPFGADASPDTRDGEEWDTYDMDIPIPAAATKVTVQLFSNNVGGSGLPASLYWVVGALEVLDPPPPPPPPGGEGCTPGYWKQPHHFDSWAAPYESDQLFSTYFEDAFPGMSLLDVLKQGGGGLKALGRHTVAALLNAASGGVAYDLTTGQVIDAFNDLYPEGSKQDYNGLKDIFAGFNEQGCPLN